MLGAALGASVAACGGDGRCDPDAPDNGIDLVGKKLYVSDSHNNRIRVVNLP